MEGLSGRMVWWWRCGEKGRKSGISGIESVTEGMAYWCGWRKLVKVVWVLYGVWAYYGVGAE